MEPDGGHEGESPFAAPGAVGAPHTERAEPFLRRRPTIRFGLAAAVSGVAFWLVYGLFVLTGSGQNVENLSLIGAALRSLAERQASLESLSLISLLSFAFAILFVFLMAVGRRRFGLAVSIAFAMGASVVAAELLKVLLPRPGLADGPAWILRNSFPSGSATIGAAVGLALLQVSPDRLRWAALIGGAAIAVVVGQATQVSGWHRMSDVIGGILLAATVACAALVVLSLTRLVRRSNQSRVSGRVMTLLVVAGAGAIVLGCAILGLSFVFPVLIAPEGAKAAFAHTTLDLVGSGLTILIFVAFGRVIDPYALGTREDVAPRDAAPASLENT